MPEELRVLFVEDSAEDVELAADELRKAGLAFTTRRVETKDALLRELEQFSPDLVLSDFNMPIFNGLEALAVVRGENPETPFLFVSGNIGEERAIEALKQGATDYILKDRMGRLGHCVKRAMLELRERRERREAEDALKKSEDRLRQLQKMDAIGRLAGSVAHDFNNLLTAISGYGELLMAELAPGDPKRLDAEEICRTAQRGAALTRQLLTFSRKQSLTTAPLELGSVVSGMEPMLRRLLGENVRWEAALEPAAGLILANRGQLEQILLNLAVNARDAMPGGGLLRLEVAPITLENDFIQSHPEVRAGRHVSLKVSDSGSGMPPEVLSHLFEPFFTTKEPGKGTGLGLSTVYGIVRQFAGCITVESEPGRGTTFNVLFPVAVPAAPKKAEPAPAAAPAAAGKETVLVVDDEDSVRFLARRVLAMNGYQVLDAPNAEKALEICREAKSPIALLATDLGLPRMNGAQLAAQVRALLPGVKVLFLSGYSAEDLSDKSPLPAGAAFLEKPFKPTDLVASVRAALDGGQAA